MLRAPKTLSSAIAGALVLAAAVAAPTSAEPGPSHPAEGNWSVTCKFTHRAMDDPIVFPRRPGASHMHDFFGNASINAFSTHRRLLAARNRCTRPKDHAGYWAPSMRRGGNREGWVRPVLLKAYYLAAKREPRSIRPFPRGLRMVAGDSGATEPQAENVVSWFCGQFTKSRSPEPIPCPRGQHLRARIVFPDCSNGRADSADHVSHLTRSRRTRGSQLRSCPASHPIPVPRLVVLVDYPHSAGVGSELSSGSRFSMHSDFFEAWGGKSLRRLINDCIAVDFKCGNGGRDID